jgi:hypothetical protein
MHATVPCFTNVVTAAQRPFCERHGISLSMLTRLFSEGEVDSVVIGGRFRHVILKSWYDYIERRRTGRQRDPVEKKAAALAYRASVPPAASAGARRAMAGKIQPGRPRGVRNRRTAPPPEALEISPKNRS